MFNFSPGHSVRQSILSKRHRVSPAGAIPLHACLPVAEVLEARQMLSVTAATLAGPVGTAEDTWDSETLANGTVFETNTEKVIGSTTNPFGGGDAIETYETSSETSGAITTTSENYDNLNGSGLVAYGSTAVVDEAGTTSNTSTSWSPPEVVIPPLMVAATPYTETTTQTVTTTGATSGTDVVQESETFTLESAQQSVTVPAGTYTAYVVDISITATSTETISGIAPITTGPTTNTGKEYFAQNVGLVEFAFGDGETELTKAPSGGGGGGGGGGGTTTTTTDTSALIPTIFKSTLPTAAIGGIAINGAVAVTVTNSGTTTNTGKDTVAIYASTDGSIDSTATQIAAVSRPLPLKAGKAARLTLSVRKLSLPVGSYSILAQITDASGNVSTSATGTSLTVAAPVISLAGIISAVKPVATTPGKVVSFTLTLTNAGNVAPTGVATLALGLSSDGTTVAIPVITEKRNLSIKPGGKPVAVKLSMKIPTAAAAMNLDPIVTLTQGTTTLTVASTTLIAVG